MIHRESTQAFEWVLTQSLKKDIDTDNSISSTYTTFRWVVVEVFLLTLDKL
jgi:hypothetical protein